MLINNEKLVHNNINNITFSDVIFLFENFGNLALFC